MKTHKKYLLATTCALIALGAGDVANAAGPAPLPMPMWAGAYVGANIGVARLNATASQVTPSYGYYGPCTDYYGSASCATSATGLVGGGEAGYDWQSRYFVYGVVADWDWTGLKHTVTSPNYGGSFTAQVGWLASVRGRMGLALDDTLVYFTGGVAVGQVKSNTYSIGSSGNGGSYGTLDSDKVGWVAGAGVEHKLNQQWSIKGEFLYYDLGNANNGTNRVGISYASEFTHEILLGQVGLEFHF